MRAVVSHIMGGKAFLIMLLSGLCTLPSCFPRQYHLVEEGKTWTEAQSYCRQKYTDLATIESEEDVDKLAQVLGRHHTGHIWIGLYNDIKSWRWSLENENYYGEGEAEFRMWRSGEPDNRNNNQNCARLSNGNWQDVPCSLKESFVCYNARGPSKFIWVKEKKTWTEAQSYCRERYTDLASVRNQTENQEIHSLVDNDDYVWIGLFKAVWKWSDGSAMSFTNWETPSEADGPNTETCGAASSGKWQSWPCSTKFYFVCYSADVSMPKEKMQVVRLKLNVPDSSVDPEQMKEAMLQQLHQRLKDQGLSDVRLRWVMQSDGKVFHKEEEEEEEEEESCGFI